MDNKKTNLKSRRSFFSLLMGEKDKTMKPEMIKMLTAEGKLVEVDKAILDEIVKKQKATNKEIYDWMKNPSKKD